jgi:hypothetical protein
MKPFAGGGWKNVYKLNDLEDFFQKHAETAQLVMLLQEEIVFEEYYRCYCIGGKYVRIMPYEPRNPHHLRYVSDFNPSAEKLKLMEDIVLRINHYLGYDFNTVELAYATGYLMLLIFAILLPMPNEPALEKRISIGWWKQLLLTLSRERWRINRTATILPGVSTLNAVQINKH